MQLRDVQNGVFKHAKPNRPNRSRFDLSRVTNFTCDSGMIIPFDYFETLPGDSFSLSADVALETLPTVTNVLTPYKVKMHWYYLRNSDLWAGWDTFITKGRTGNVNLTIPRVKFSFYHRIRYADKSELLWFPQSYHSLSAFLGVLPGVQNNQKPYLPYGYDDIPSYANYRSVSVSALPFMAYQNIVKYNYVNQNLLQSNTALFPVEGDSDWRLPYNIRRSTISTVNGLEPQEFRESSDVSSSGTILKDPCIYGPEDEVVLLTSLRYAPFDDDYFTSSLPWLQRGNLHTLDLDVYSDASFYLNDYVDVPIYLRKGGVVDSFEDNLTWSSENYQEEGAKYTLYGNRRSGPVGDDITMYGRFREDLYGTLDTSVSLSANQFRELLAYSVWQERNATVNGSYNSMIWVHWSVDPNEHEHKPIYIGGSVSYVQFGETMQTSATPPEGSVGGTPQGTVTGMGRMYDSARYGRFDCPDYGYIMGIMIISPTTTYNTQLDKNLLKQIMEDYPQPEFESLSPEAILNKEIYFSNNSSVDGDLFGYQERYSYYKTRNNRNAGLFMSKSTDDNLFSAATQAREFNNLPKLSYEFVTQSPNNTRRDWLAYPKYPMFKVQVASHVDAIRPLSYAVRPNTFGF